MENNAAENLLAAFAHFFPKANTIGSFVGGELVEGTGELIQLYDAATGKVLETVDFAPNSCDPHGLAMHDGKLISCDAGIHPGWPNNDSPTAGWIVQIDFI